jgi:hypothetical protein
MVPDKSQNESSNWGKRRWKESTYISCSRSNGHQSSNDAVAEAKDRKSSFMSGICFVRDICFVVPCVTQPEQQVLED